MLFRSLSEEYLRVHRRLGVPLTDLFEIAREGYRAAFIDEARRASLLARFEVWAAGSGIS